MPYKSKVQPIPFRLLLNLLLTILIFGGAELGRTLGIKGEPLAISAVWPSTGISLAALLLFDTYAWPGIFAGNFFYNFFHLYSYGSAVSTPILTALTISLGSLFQALLGNYVIRRYSSKDYFNTFKDVVIFLLPGGILACLLAPTLGVIALYFFKPMAWQLLFKTWLTFWIGDSMGVLVFTPFLVVWTLKPFIRNFGLEALLMLVSFFAITLLTISFRFPALLLFYFPLGIWATDRFQMHGATLIVFLISLVIIIPFSFGYIFPHAALVSKSLIGQVIFLEIAVAVFLLLAAVINEREAAFRLLQAHNIDLQHIVEAHKKKLKDKNIEVYIKNKLSSLRLLTSNIALHMQMALQHIDSFSITSLDYLKRLQSSFSSFESKLGPELFSLLLSSIEALENHLFSIIKFEKETGKIAKIIEEQSILGTSVRIKLQSVNINSLLTDCLNQARAELMKSAPDFTFNLIEEFDKNVQMLLIFPEDLAHAFSHFINHSFASIREKKERLDEGYLPELRVRTEDRKDHIEIKIRNNGLGASEEQLKNYFLSFLSKGSYPLAHTSVIEEEKDLGLILAHDIITFIYGGKIKVNSSEGDYLEIVIALPVLPKDFFS